MKKVELKHSNHILLRTTMTGSFLAMVSNGHMRVYSSDKSFDPKDVTDNSEWKDRIRYELISEKQIMKKVGQFIFESDTPSLNRRTIVWSSQSVIKGYISGEINNSTYRPTYYADVMTVITDGGVKIEKSRYGVLKHKYKRVLYKVMPMVVFTDFDGDLNIGRYIGNVSAADATSSVTSMLGNLVALSNGEQ